MHTRGVSSAYTMVTILRDIVQMYYLIMLVWSVFLFGSGFGSFVALVSLK